jgi:hypothetical protein
MRGKITAFVEVNGRRKKYEIRRFTPYAIKQLNALLLNLYNTTENREVADSAEEIANANGRKK